MKNNRSDLMSKHHGIFTENFAIFFSNAGKYENVPEMMHLLEMMYIHLCCIYVKQTFLFDRTPYLVRT